MKFTKIPETTFKELQLNAGVLTMNFDPDGGTLTRESILGATSGGVHFSAMPTFIDLGENIDNCPKNTKELMDVSEWKVTINGTFKTVSAASAKFALAAADVTEGKITPRNHLEDSDFKQMWWIGDYSDKNDETNGGYIAIHMMNVLSTGGFEIQTHDEDSGDFAFEFSAHYSLEKPDEVPFELYIKAGTAA